MKRIVRVGSKNIHCDLIQTFVCLFTIKWVLCDIKAPHES